MFRPGTATGDDALQAATSRMQTEQPNTTNVITKLGAATIRVTLPEPLVIGATSITFREYALVSVTDDRGEIGRSFTLTRGGPVAAIVRDQIAPLATGASSGEPKELFARLQRANLASFATGVGLRALSLVDLAIWDLLGRRENTSIAELLGSRAPATMPVTAIVGYPPTLRGAGVAAQVRSLYARGWRRFKLPIAASASLSYERLRAAHDAAPGCWLGLDAGWSFDTPALALAFLEGLPVELGWFEDIFPPGDIDSLVALRRQSSVPIAMGDDQGGSYFPDALINANAVDVVRIDLTTMGGISGCTRVIERCVQAGVAFAPHMSGHLHAAVLAALGHDVPIEWGFPGSGVDPFEDSLSQPTVADGRMQPFAPAPGLDLQPNLGWLAEQTVDDPDNTL